MIAIFILFNTVVISALLKCERIETVFDTN